MNISMPSLAYFTVRPALFLSLVGVMPAGGVLRGLFLNQYIPDQQSRSDDDGAVGAVKGRPLMPADIEQ